jgi:hypothetical protein
MDGMTERPEQKQRARHESERTVPASDERQARLAAQLRANLRRRKTQTAARAALAKESKVAEAGEPTD